MNEILPGKYQHYKGGLYHVIGVTKHTETQEELVAYLALTGEPTIWVRPLANFLEKVLVNGQEVPRFQRLK